MYMYMYLYLYMYVGGQSVDGREIELSGPPYVLNIYP
jgi:hypothetical protein